MKDNADRVTVDLFPLAKKRGRPLTGVRAKTPAERKREQRLRQSSALHERKPEEWTEAECLLALTAGGQWREEDFNDFVVRRAWERFGILRGFCDSHT